MVMTSDAVIIQPICEDGEAQETQTKIDQQTGELPQEVSCNKKIFEFIELILVDSKLETEAGFFRHRT